MTLPEPSSDNVIALFNATSMKDLTDDRLARQIAQLTYQDLRYVPEFKRWITRSNDRWVTREDDAIPTEAVRLFLNAAADELSQSLSNAAIRAAHTKRYEEQRVEILAKAEASAKRQIASLLSNRKIEDVIRLLKKDPLISADVDLWDRDPWLLNTPDGTIDLRTGRMRQHSSDDFITMVTATGPVDVEPKLWLKTLHTVMHGDASMVRYLQKIMGYCLVGETTEHQMYFAYGTGANGKSVIMNTLRDLLGMYGREANIETFIMNSREQHPTELADLRGARLVTCSETNSGSRWNEARIKKLTGGDPIKARFMGKDFFEYKPQFKLFLAGNQKPKLTNVDEAIQRRFRLIPFTYTVPAAERDTNLSVKLMAEWPAILNWCIEGTQLWLSEGLEAPESVRKATQSYMNQEDALATWIMDTGVTVGAGPEAFTYLGDLYDNWAAWAANNHEEAKGKNKFCQMLEDREPLLHIKKHRKAGGMGFIGIKLQTTPIEGN